MDIQALWLAILAAVIPWLIGWLQTFLPAA
jgi:hypothetical protein